jgi:hypothetical protein
MRIRTGILLATLALGGCATPVDELRELPPAGTATLPGGAGKAAQCLARQLGIWPGSEALPSATNTVQLTDAGAYVYGASGGNSMWLIDAVNSGGNAVLTYRIANTVAARETAMRLIEGVIATCRLGG